MLFHAGGVLTLRSSQIGLAQVDYTARLLADSDRVAAAGSAH